MELPGLAAKLLVALALSGALTLSVPGGALAAGATATSVSTAADPNTPVLVSDQNAPPAGYRMTAAKVERIAARSPTIVAERRRHPRATAYEYT